MGSGLERPGDRCAYIFVQVRRLKTPADWSTILHKFTICTVERIVARLGPRPAVLVLDCAGVAIEQIQTGLALAQMVLSNFAGRFSLVHVVDLPFWLKMAARLIMSMLAAYRAQIVFCGRGDVLRVHGAANCPPSLGGHCKDIESTWDLCPPDAPSIEHFGLQHGFSKCSTRKYRDILKELV